jgi:soluble lytic murein transglycosylase-like protein
MKQPIYKSKFDEKYKELMEGKYSNLFASALLATSLINSPQNANAASKPHNSIIKTHQNNKTIIQKRIKEVLDSLNIGDSLIDFNYIDKLIHLESNYNPYAVGDNNKAKGLLQIHKAAWETVLKYHKDIDYNYNTDAFDINKNIEMGVLYLKWIEDRLNRTPYKATKARIYAAWNAGYDNLKNCNYNVDLLAKYNDVFNDHLLKYKTLGN